MLMIEAIDGILMTQWPLDSSRSELRLGNRSFRLSRSSDSLDWSITSEPAGHVTRE